jgi:NitT/TauT family transport system substrate-binding protein
MNKNVIIIGITLLIVAGMAWGYSQMPTTTNEATKPIVIATSYWPGQYWIDVADAKGFFKEAGLNVKIVNVQDDYFGSIYKVLGGAIDVNVIGFFDMAHTNALGGDLVMVALTDNSLGSEGLVVSKKITSVKDLENKSIAVPRDTYDEFFLDTILNRADSNLKQTVTYIDMVPEKAYGFFEKGEIDGMVTWDPFLSDAVSKLEANTLFTISELGGAVSGIVSTKRFIATHANEMQKIIGVWERATTHMSQHLEESYAIIARKYGVSISDVAQLHTNDTTFSLQDNISLLPNPMLRPPLSESVPLLRSYLQNKLPGAIIDFATYLNMNFVREAAAQ